MAASKDEIMEGFSIPTQDVGGMLDSHTHSKPGGLANIEPDVIGVSVIRHSVDVAAFVRPLDVTGRLLPLRLAEPRDY